MGRTFNCGVGGVLIVSKTVVQEVVDKLAEAGEKASIIGVVEKRTGTILFHIHSATAKTFFFIFCSCEKANQQHIYVADFPDFLNW
jgi:hypothetical protein